MHNDWLIEFKKFEFNGSNFLVFFFTLYHKHLLSRDQSARAGCAWTGWVGRRKSRARFSRLCAIVRGGCAASSSLIHDFSRHVAKFGNFNKTDFNYEITWTVGMNFTFFFKYVIILMNCDRWPTYQPSRDDRWAALVHSRRRCRRTSACEWPNSQEALIRSSRWPTEPVQFLTRSKSP